MNTKTTQGLEDLLLLKWHFSLKIKSPIQCSPIRNSAGLLVAIDKLILKYAWNAN